MKNLDELKKELDAARLASAKSNNDCIYLLSKVDAKERELKIVDAINYIGSVGRTLHVVESVDFDQCIKELSEAAWMNNGVKQDADANFTELSKTRTTEKDILTAIFDGVSEIVTESLKVDANELLHGNGKCTSGKGLFDDLEVTVMQEQKTVIERDKEAKALYELIKKHFILVDLKWESLGRNVKQGYYGLIDDGVQIAKGKC